KKLDMITFSELTPSLTVTEFKINVEGLDYAMLGNKLEPTKDVIAINSNFIHKAFEGYEQYLSKPKDTSNTETASTDLGSKQVSACTLDFLLPSEWALKERQKFGKKGGGKRISKYVIPYFEAYFLAGDVNKSEKYTAQEMYNELKELVEEGILEAEEIPKVSTIGN
ncbi:hypothetical protein RhiirA5_372007, partial [Rhizophagus irregularis]